MEGRIKTILIDDDQEALMLLETYLKVLPEIDIKGKASSGKEGMDMIRNLLPDLVFLDIDMPGINGIKIARAVKEKNYSTQIVFTTAFNNYAYDVIETKPLDYLVKPFGPNDLLPVISKYREKVSKEESERKIEILVQSQRTCGKVKFPTPTGVVILHPDDVALIRVKKGNSCELFLADGTVETVKKSLLQIVEEFQNPNIYRVSKSVGLNLKFLRKVDRTNRTCTISIREVNYEETLSRKNIRFLEKMRCFPIT
ncbi:MAG: response regulator transcription factor [Prolixibacteraceae bacterium]|nr:response regulator transcription factor [Prolixibacteraceae bacterium]